SPCKLFWAYGSLHIARRQNLSDGDDDSAYQKQWMSGIGYKPGCLLCEVLMSEVHGSCCRLRLCETFYFAQTNPFQRLRLLSVRPGNRVRRPAVPAENDYENLPRPLPLASARLAARAAHGSFHRQPSGFRCLCLDGPRLRDLQFSAIRPPDLMKQ